MKKYHKSMAGVCLLGVALLASGCSTSPSYACGSPEGGKCQSVTDAYLAMKGRQAKGSGSTDGDSTGKPDAPARVTQYIPEGVAIRSMPSVMRVWIAPWEDNNGVFHDQSYNYFVADRGEWTLRANTEKSIYANGYMALERPTEKQPAGGDGDKPKDKLAMTTQAATESALDFAAGN